MDKNEITTIQITTEEINEDNNINNKEEKEKKEVKQKITIEDWVNNWLITNNAKYNVRMNTISINGKIDPLNHITSLLILASDRAGFKGVTELIKHTLYVWIPKQRELRRQQIIKHIKYDPNIDTQEIDKFIKTITSKENPIDIAVLKHFIWQIKRKLNDLKVDHHMMPIFYGKTGVGKTEAIKQLLDPIYDLYKSPNDMTVINDERSTKILNDCHCLFFDEMAKARKVDVDRLKNVISSEDATYRAMRTNDNPTVLNNVTFIGATNTPLQELIYDPTSMRRFWQIETADKIDWDQINSINYLNIWKGVDETKSSPVIHVYEKIKKIQHLEYRNFFPLEDFLTNYCSPLGEEDDKKWQDSEQLFTVYKTWLQWQNKGNLTPSISRFRSAFNRFKTKSEGTTRVYYEVNGIDYMKRRLSNPNTWVFNIYPDKFNFNI